MPQERSARARSGARAGSGTRRAGWGYVGLCAFVLAVAVSGCSGTAPSSPVGAGTPLVATSNTSQSTTGLNAPSQNASAASTPPATSTATQPKPPTTTQATASKPSLCGAPVNPFGYNLCGRGGYIYNASPARVCSYFNCVANFGNSPGYMIECKDSTYSTSGGACSDHKGVWRPVYSG